MDSDPHGPRFVTATANTLCYLWTFSAGTVFLWWTWWQTKSDLHKAQESFGSVPLLDVDVSNETAFLVFAVVASVLTVCFFVNCEENHDVDPCKPELILQLNMKKCAACLYIHFCKYTFILRSKDMQLQRYMCSQPIPVPQRLWEFPVGRFIVNHLPI